MSPTEIHNPINCWCGSDHIEISELHSRSAQRRVAAMTPPREPRMNCPTCGHAVVVVGSDEGTQHYEPIEAEAAGAPLREALLEQVGEALVAVHVGDAHGEGDDIPLVDFMDPDLFERVTTAVAAYSSRAALAATSYFGQPPPDDWEDMPADATPVEPIYLGEGATAEDVERFRQTWQQLAATPPPAPLDPHAESDRALDRMIELEVLRPLLLGPPGSGDWPENTYTLWVGQQAINRYNQLSTTFVERRPTRAAAAEDTE